MSPWRFRAKTKMRHFFPSLKWGRGRVVLRNCLKTLRCHLDRVWGGQGWEWGWGGKKWAYFLPRPQRWCLYRSPRENGSAPIPRKSGVGVGCEKNLYFSFARVSRQPSQPPLHPAHASRSLFLLRWIIERLCQSSVRAVYFDYVCGNVNTTLF